MVETFGPRLRRLRMAKGLRQDDLQEMTGIAASTIGHYEYNDFSASAYNLATLADALDVPMDYLWRGRELAPVVHAHWECVDAPLKTSEKYCSNCGCHERIFSYNHDAYIYCPHCGAKMDEEVQE